MRCRFPALITKNNIDTNPSAWLDLRSGKSNTGDDKIRGVELKFQWVGTLRDTVVNRNILRAASCETQGKDDGKQKRRF